MATLNQNSATKDDNSKLLNPQHIYSFTTKEHNDDDDDDDGVAIANDDNEDDDFYHVKICSISSPKTNKQLNPSFTRTPPALVRYISSSAAVPSCRQIQVKIGHNCSSHSAAMGLGGGWEWRGWWCLWLIMAACVLSMSSGVMAAPQSCILCDKNDLMAKTSHGNYEEYLFEHQVTRHDAINALKKLNESFYEGLQSDSSCNAVRCTDKVKKYCLGPQFINDHCLCEVGHSTEGLPFVPHICYVGERLHTASVGSCFFYEEVKECCCSSLLAKEWRHISSASSLHRNSTILSNYFVLFITLLYLIIRR